MAIAETSRKSPRARQTGRYVAATMVAMVVYGLLVGGATVQPLLLVPAMLAALTVVLAAAFWMRSLDEAKQQAHYLAWYWGGSAGLTFSMLVLVALLPLMLQPHAIERAFAVLPGIWAAPISFLLGFFLGVFPAGVGYLIWWAVIWMRR